MKKTLLITILTLAAVALGAAALLAALGAFSGSIDDPAVAPCRRPPTTVSAARVVLDHREALVRFTCNEAQLAGTLYLPLRPGPHPAVVWVHGSGEQPRLSYGPLVRVIRRGRDRLLLLRQARRRRVGGRLLPGRARPLQPRHRRRGRRDRGRPLLVSRRRAPRWASSARAQPAGSPRARPRNRAHVAFIALASPGVLQHSLVARFEQEATGGGSTGEIEQRLPSWKPSGYDPTPFLERLDVPALWLFGGADRNVPAAPQRRAGSGRSNSTRNKDWTIIVYPGAGHGLFDDPPTDPRAAPTAEAWVRDHVARRESQDVTARPNKTRPQRP